MKTFLRNNWITLALSIAFAASTVLAVRNYFVIKENQTSLQQTDLVIKTTELVLSKITHGLDLGVRGFGLTQDDKLLIPYHEAVQVTPRVFHKIDSLLTLQHYPQRQDAVAVMNEVNNYIKFSNDMIRMARNGQQEEFSRLLKEDRGYNLWKKYTEFSTPLFKYEENLAAQSLKNYQSAVRGNLILQFIILVLGLPMILLFVRRVNREQKRRESTLREVDHTDKVYVFDNGEETKILTEDINSRAVNNIKEASAFIMSLANGNYDVKWNGLTSKNLPLNEKTLAGNLFRLRDRLNSVKMEDERRNWVNEGLALFSDLVRSNQHDADALGFKTISFLSKYINAQQGSLFVAEESEDGQIVLNLKGCYAFEKRKFIEKSIDPGSGLIGQTYLEGEPVVLKEVPQGYTHITSGLGDATPRCVTIVPLKQDSKVICVVEFASFHEILPHQILYIQKAGEFLASAIASSITAQEMKKLLEEASLREEQLKQNEEEHRQNLEELQAIQEQMQRNIKEQTNDERFQMV